MNENLLNTVGLQQAALLQKFTMLQEIRMATKNDLQVILAPAPWVYR
jgi:hypothetical protein